MTTYESPSPFTRPVLETALNRADRLFEQSYRRGQMKQFWAALLGRSREMPALGDVEARVAITGEYTLETRPVRLSKIVGSHSSTDHYDHQWYPLARRDKGRWTSVASALLVDVTRLPPVVLVQVGDEYYVIDGHHRVSAALRLGYIYIDADVTVWEIAAAA